MKQIEKIVYLIFLLTLPSCKDSIINPIDNVKASIIPFAIGNKWTYVDSLYTDSGIIVDTFVTEISYMRKENSLTWWEFSHWFNPSIYAREFTVTNDSIFSLQYNEGPHGIVSIKSLEYLYPINADTTFYRSLYDGDVVINKATLYSSTIVTPAYVFSESILIFYEVAEEFFREIVVPGIGMVDLTIENHSTISIYRWWTRRRILLLNYNLTK